jgi:hypothetical protein
VGATLRLSPCSGARNRRHNWRNPYLLPSHLPAMATAPVLAPVMRTDAVVRAVGSVQSELSRQLAGAVNDIDAQAAKCCSWGSRMPWLPVRHDPRLVKFLLAGGAWAGQDGVPRATLVEIKRLILAFSKWKAGAARHKTAKEDDVQVDQAASAPPTSTAAVSAASASAASASAASAVDMSASDDGPGASHSSASHPVATSGVRFWRGPGQRFGVLHELQRTPGTRIEKASDKDRNGQTVVLKVYYPLDHASGGGADESPVTRARQELELLERCAHPHVVRALGFFQEDSNRELWCAPHASLRQV